MSKRWLWLAAAATLGSALFPSRASLQRRSQAPPCSGGRFLVVDTPLINPALQVEAVIMEGARVAIGQACPIVTAKFKRTKRGTGIRAVWRTCEGVAGKGKLTAVVTSDCRGMTGTFVARKSKIKRVFSARLSECGDGVLDAEGGERCEGALGCAADEHCAANCRCVPNGGSSTTTPTTPTTTIPPVSFSGQVQAIFTAQCATAGCHTGPYPQQNLDLRPVVAYTELVNADSTQCVGMKLVAPGAAGQSYLIAKLEGAAACFLGTPMPPTAPLPPEDVATIRTWITEGAPNN